MKRMTCLIAVAALLLSMAACGNTTPDAGETTETTAPIETTVPATVPTYEEVANPVTFFSLSLCENFDSIRSITVFPNEDGTAYVEYVGDVKKVGNLDANIFHGITAAMETSGLVQLNGQDAWGEGEASGSMYVEYADGSCVAFGFSGEGHEAYAQGYAAMDGFFAELTAALPVYVPQPMVMGEVDAALLEELTAILNGSGMEALDAFTIMQVAKDDYFSYTLGLSSDEGIASAVSCAPMMMTTAYSLVVVSLEDGANADTVCSDFEFSMDWMKWVCVAPTNALIATKGNLVLCLMAADTLYTQTAAGVEAAGWATVKTLENPNR